MDLADTVAEVGTPKQLQIKPRFKLGSDDLKINIQCVRQIGCSYSGESSSGQN